LQAGVREERLQRERDATLLRIGNLVHESVPVHRDEVHGVGARAEQ
jgi:seryl-tRNA synthetase